MSLSTRALAAVAVYGGALLTTTFLVVLPPAGPTAPVSAGTAAPAADRDALPGRSPTAAARG